MQIFSLGESVLITIILGVVASMNQWASAQEEAKKTFTYKNVDKCNIQADVYQRGQEKHRPVVVVELHPMNWPEIGVDRRQVAELLKELRYQLTPLDGQTDPLAEYGHVVLQPATGANTPPAHPIDHEHQ